MKEEVPETKDTTHDVTRRELTSLPRFYDAFMNENMDAGFESQAPKHGADAASIDGSPAVVTPPPKGWDGGGPLHLRHWMFSNIFFGTVKPRVVLYVYIYIHILDI